MKFALTAALTTLCTIPSSGAVISELPKGMKEMPGAQALEMATGSRNSNLVHNLLGTWSNSITSLNPAELADFMKCIGKGVQPAKAAQIIAISRQYKILIDALLSNQGTKEFGAAALASKATLTMLDELKLAELAAMAPEGKWQSAFRRREGGRGPGSGGAGGKKERFAIGDATGLPITVDLLTSLIQDRNPNIRDYGMIAAAGFAVADASVAQAIAAIEAKSGIVPGVKLLYLARTGQTLPADLVDTAYKASKQPRMISSVNAELASVDPRVPSAAFAGLAIAITKDASQLQRLHKELNNKDIRTTIEAARAIVEIADPSSTAVMIDLLETRHWPLLIEACEYLGRVPSEEAIEPLIKRLDKEEGRFRRDCIYALSSIAGNQYGRQTAAEWKDWHKKAKSEGWTVDSAASQSYRNKYRIQDVSLNGFGNFYGLQITSSRFAFVLDSSNSMSGDKIIDLQSHATEVIEQVPNFVKYNIVDFGGRVSVMYEGGLVNDKKLGLSTIGGLDLTAGTRSYDASEVAFDLAGVDSIYLFSDGAPVRCQIQDWNEILSVSNLITRYRPLAIHTICFQAGEQNAEAMHQYANEQIGDTAEIE